MTKTKKIADSQDSGSKISIQEISLPKGGGAVTSVGDSFQTNLFSGTGSYSIPLPITTARGLEPQLQLVYDSSRGNSPFGLGFNVDVPYIGIIMRNGIPLYNGKEKYAFNEGVEFVPLTETLHGETIIVCRQETDNSITYSVTSYLQQEEEAFTLIEQWQNDATKNIFWKTISKDNQVTIYGKSADTSILNPAEPTQVCRWLIESVTDSKGNKIQFSYKRENEENIPDNIYKAGHHYDTQLYLHIVQYGNYFDVQQQEQWAFQLVFNYGEYDLPRNGQAYFPAYTPVRTWPARKDCFSTFRAGFEVRTCRLCSSIMLFHSFTELGTEPMLVRALTLAHDETDIFSFVTSVQQSGYRLNSDNTWWVSGAAAATFSYTSFAPPPAPDFKQLMVHEEGKIPGGQNIYMPVDLYGEGLPGFLMSNSTGTLYWQPLGNGVYDYPEAPDTFPSDRDLTTPGNLITDIDGNGQLELVVNENDRSGYYTKKEGDEGWNNFVEFQQRPPQSSSSLEFEMADLNGDGKTDMISIGSDSVTYFRSNGTEGFAAPEQRIKVKGLPSPPDSPNINISFADVFGDGGQHRVSVLNGAVNVWPSLGHGNFGNVIRLGNAPSFRQNEQPTVLLADINGSGCADVVLVYSTQAEIYINQSGNSFAPAFSITLPDVYAPGDQVSFADINGNGTACLVFTKTSPEVTHYYHDFLAEDIAEPFASGVKPYLLYAMSNGLGLSTKLKYSSSVEFYLRDKKAGSPWITHLPFPVQVVEKMIISDSVNGNTLTRRFAYHEGCYDNNQKEFLGFGYVESWDAEQYESFSSTGTPADFPVNDVNSELIVAPVYTREWYLTGIMEGSDALLLQYQSQYFNGDPDECGIPAYILDDAIKKQPSSVVANACLMLKGKLLRREVYGLDGSALEKNPYTVEQHCTYIRSFQESSSVSGPVFTSYEPEAITYNYERQPNDPRTEHQFTLETDKYNNALKTASVFYPRRNSSDPALIIYPQQQQLYITINRNGFINQEAPSRWIGVDCCQTQYEAGGVSIVPGQYFSFAQMEAIVNDAMNNVISYSQPFTQGKVQARCFGNSRTYYWNAGQTSAMNLCDPLPDRMLIHHREEAVFDPGFITQAYGDKIDTATIENSGGYYLYDGYWWNRGLVQNYFTNANAFYMPERAENSFVANTSSLYANAIAGYDNYYLRETSTSAYVTTPPGKDPVYNITTALIDYYIMSPWQLTGPNDNVSQVLFDPLGKVYVSASHGYENGQYAGDMDLVHYTRMPDKGFCDVLNNPSEYLQGAGSYYYYEEGDMRQPCTSGENPQPARCVVLQGQQYGNGINPQDRIILTDISYFDGMGEITQHKSYAGGSGAQSWVVSGKVVYNNKKKPAQEYLPFYSDKPDFEDQQTVLDDDDLVPPTVTHYDPLLRVIRIDTPKLFFSCTGFTSWETISYDTDDTVRDSVFYKTFMANYPANPTDQQKDEKDALDKAAVFYNTPSREVMNSAGNVFYSIQNNLGEVSSNAFEEMVNGSGVTSQQLWDELVLKKYLVIGPYPEYGAWTSPAVQVYAPDFTFELSEPFQQFIPQLTDFFRQNGLITNSVPDINGRHLSIADPRLYYSNCHSGTDYQNFINLFPMMVDQPARTQSCDAGLKQVFADIYGNIVLSWDARGFCTRQEYDHLQRPTGVYVTGSDGSLTLNQYTERIVYGELVTDAAKNNLIGNIYTYYDQAGKLLIDSYSFAGKPLKQTRYFLDQYTQEPNWDDPQKVPLEKEAFVTTFQYNAAGMTTQEQMPDKGQVLWTYNQMNQLNTVNGIFPDNTTQTYISSITYNASGSRLAVYYAGGTKTAYTYEPATERLQRLLTTRSDNRSNVQDTWYTYDPVGNLTRCRDYSEEDVFCNNQLVEPLMGYTLDAIYRLINASGRQHIGIQKNTHTNGFKQSIYAQLCPTAPLNDQQQLENYAEHYTYDDSGNLVELNHTAKSASWTRVMNVPASSNRAIPQDEPTDAYDADGNLLQLNNLYGITWNYRNNISGITTIAREDANDADYYVYDHAGERVRKVTTQKVNDGLLLIYEKRYIGNYEVKRTYNNSIDPANIVSECQTERVVDDKKHIVNVLYWTIDSKREKQRQQRYQAETLIQSVAVELTETGDIISYEEFYPFGGTAIIAGNNQVDVEPKEYRFTGKECDDSSGLYYYGARYYISWLGRWMSADPAGPADGLNLYEYVNNNPLINNDPAGTTKGKPYKSPSSSGTKKKIKKKKFGIVRDTVTGELRFVGRPSFDSKAKKIKVRFHATKNRELNEDRRHVIGYDDTLRPMFTMVARNFADAGKSAEFVQQLKLQYQKHGVARAPSNNDPDKHLLFALTKLNSVVSNLPAGLASQNQAIEHIRQQGMRLKDTINEAYMKDDNIKLPQLKTIMKEGFAAGDGDTAITVFANEQRKLIRGWIDNAENEVQLNDLLHSVIASTGIDLSSATNSKSVNEFALNYSYKMSAIRWGSTSDLNKQLDDVMSILSMK
ncbi:SpvB/TcaC N-terminal domain-containing protein [Chitinophaga sancti]|uniref:RHS repeat-associated core domain-containing protein n=1 Tax=Chitinophaga sancti TaxID=1004 RepID=A0A1K1LWS7_9BACT|nr:SpvB/TcaC N-terminal domain-containing protein [Chitinophaga sancti]WQD64777.1 SpvB/TcaC N-terminal domain-containing protein [Chitinophaga sancti]WQG89599.1 SpvB/TcaC N-terminal domain-containing protein [Chitinophaga sancti]SFW15381.1 RHS repeat-associated core domain-containing protein [Chitinophaga sancti]